jgi:hypothetical protein
VCQLWIRVVGVWSRDEEGVGGVECGVWSGTLIAIGGTISKRDLSTYETHFLCQIGSGGGGVYRQDLLCFSSQQIVDVNNKSKKKKKKKHKTPKTKKKKIKNK